LKDIRVYGMTRSVLALAAALTASILWQPARGQEATIAAVVNNNSITSVDLNHRVNLVLFATGLPRTPEVAQRLRPQVLDTMIDETLEMQAAKDAGIDVAQREIDSVLANMEQQNKLPPGGLDAFLANKGVEKPALERQIKASLSWSKLVERKFASQATVGEDEIDDELARIKENLDKPRSLVSEIFLAVDASDQDARVKQAAERIVQQLRNGASFDALARAFSQNAAAASGGDLGWLVPGQLDPQLDQYLKQMQPGQLVGPVRTTDGYHILALRDRRLPGGSSPSDVTVDLRQINLPLPAKPSDDQLHAALQAAGQIRDQIKDCNALADTALAHGARAAKIGKVKIGDLAAPLQPVLMGLQANEISKPLRGPNGLILLMVCDREAKEAKLPSRDQIKERLFRQKLDLLARRYLRDLRRTAFLDVRV
jgi:peptidyl-prolyl cis-trans isomerase SurA